MRIEITMRIKITNSLNKVPYLVKTGVNHHDNVGELFCLAYNLYLDGYRHYVVRK